MNIDDIRTTCLAKPYATEDFPFDETTLVFRIGVKGKIFALTDLNDSPAKIALKCDPEYAVELRERYEAVQPGWHLNKKHWNTIELDGSMPRNLIDELVELSYQLIFNSLTKKQREALPPRKD